MPHIRFQKTVIEAMPLLQGRGYVFEESRQGEVVTFRKELVPGLVCKIQFHIKNFFIPPVRPFSVTLFRHWLPDEGEELSLYEPLALPLEALLRHVSIAPFPDGQYIWEFVTRESLAKQLQKIQSYLLDIGIPYLEDPHSTMDWVFNPTREK